MPEYGTTFPYANAMAMGILDRLKPQPRWKHADPGIRLEAVRQLNDPVELASLAELDPDARIRRSCVTRIADVAVLSRIAAGDADDETRDKAADRLLVIATDPATPAELALEAVRGIADGRRLSTIAKGDAAAEAVRAEALSRLTDERALGSVARHAKHLTTANEALARLTDGRELLETAINSDQKEIALAALERVLAPAGAAQDVALLRSIEARAQQKAVARRARAILQDIEAAEAARLAAEEERRRQVAALLDALAAIGRTPDEIDPDRADAELSRIVTAWGTLEVADDLTAARFEDSRVAAEAAIVERRRRLEEAAEQARQRAEALATRDALCVRVETLDGDDVLAQLVPIEEEWRLLTPLVGHSPEADRLAERFATAVAACRKRHALSAVLAETRLALEARVAEAEALLPVLTGEPPAAALTRWQELTREARALAATLSDGLLPADDLLGRLSAVADAVAAREAAEREAARKAHDDLVVRLQRLVERTRRAVDAEAMTLREGERLMRDLGAGLEEAARKDGRDVADLASTLRGLQEKIAPRVRELRELDEWRRFANGQQQERLIAMAEAIVASLKSDMEAGRDSDQIATARALRELNAKWQEVAEGPRHSAQKLWERFRAATDFIRSRCEGYFARLREERGVNLQKKTELVEEAEKLAVSVDWARASARLQELQAVWQQLGPVPRDAARDLAHRFRAACNQFFTRRREDLAARKKVWSDNLARKEAICERAEALAASTDWDRAAAEMKQLQAEWKTIGPVRRNKSEAIWERFRAAADRFFERYHNRHRIALLDKLAERETLVVELEAFAGAESSEAPEGLAGRMQELRAGWNRGVPVPASEMRPLADRWQAAFARVLERWPAAFAGTDLDPAAVHQRMAKLVSRIEALAAEAHEPSTSGRSQTEILAARLRSALASNAMGGRASEESRWRTASDTVKDAQAAWLRLPPLTTSEARSLEHRFREACRRVLDQVRRHTADTRRKPTAQAV